MKDIKTLKDKIRREILHRRKSLPLSLRVSLSRKICNSIRDLEEFQKAKVIHLYIPVRSEVDIRPLIEVSLKTDKKVTVPVVDRKKRCLLLSEIKNYPEGLVPSIYGILEPEPGSYRIVEPEEIDLFVIPGIAFDERGYRIGYGLGYYDKLLARVVNKAYIIAPAFEIQIVGFVPVDHHDVRVDKIITEERIIICQPGLLMGKRLQML